jgi:hypothetical protein
MACRLGSPRTWKVLSVVTRPVYVYSYITVKTYTKADSN